MASIIRIKRSSNSGNPATLAAGELAYSNKEATGEFAGSGDRLYIGMGTETAGNAANHVVIGGKYFTDKLDHTPGTLTANSAIIVDTDSKIDQLNVDNLTLNGNTISSTDTDGNIIITPNGDGYVQISGTNALVIPKGTDAQQAPSIAGAIRFNTDSTSYEGYDGTNWASLGGVKSVDQLTYIKAEASPGAGDGTLYFNAKDGVLSDSVMTMDKDGLKILVATTSTGSNTGALQIAGGVSIEGALYVQGALQVGGNQASDQFLANQGAPDGNNGFSFQNDGGYDTGMFSAGDGQLSLYSNNDQILYLYGTTDSYLYTPTLHLGTTYGTISAYTQDIVLNPDSDNDNAALHISTWDNTNNLNIWNSGNRGITLGNWDNGDSLIDIGGVSGSWYSDPDDIAVWAKRNGKLNLRTNNNDIVLQNDYGNVTFRNSDGHLVVPNTIETNDSTGDVILAASNGTEKNAVFTGAGYLTLPKTGILFNDSNNISGTQIGEITWQGDDLLLDSYNGDVSISSHDSNNWTFKWNAGTPYLQLPSGAILSDSSNNSILLGNGVQLDGYSQRVVIGYQPTAQTGESWDTIAIGARAGTTNQGNNSIAMGNRAGNNNQGNDAIAIGSSPNSSVGGAGYLNQGSYAVAIGAQAAENYQSTAAVAIGNLAGQTSQGYQSVALGAGAGQTNQQEHAIAIGANAGNDSQQLTAIAIGENAGNTSQYFSAIAIGRWAGEQYQGQKAVAIGRLAGRYAQSGYAVAIGHHAGMGVFDTSAQGVNAIAIGSHAAEYSQHDNSIVIQATATGDGTGINPNQAGLFIDPIRNVNSGSQFVIYNSDTKEVTYNATNIEIDGSVITATNATTDANVILEPLGAGYVSASNAQIKNVAEPTNDTDAATKYYVDAARSGLDVKESVRLATTVDITLSGVQTIDTKTTATGQRILVKNQDSASENGIYIANDAGAWSRATDFDENTEVTSGAFTFVEDGVVNLNAGFVVTTKVVDIGTTAIDWTLFSASGTLIAGDGLSKDGYTLKVNTAATGGIEISDDSLQLKSTIAGDGLSYADGTLDVGGTTNRISVSGSAVDIDANYVGQTSITTLGTISTGTWQGTTLGSGYGGTGFSTYAKGDMLYASATDTLSKLTGGDDGKILQMNSSGVPVWGDIDGGTY